MPSVHDSRLLICEGREKNSYLCSALSGDERREIEELLRLTSGLVRIYFDESRDLFTSHLVCVHVEDVRGCRVSVSGEESQSWRLEDDS